jgi:tricorn protease
MTTQPEFSFWFSDVGWGVENYGTDPDIDVEITPQDYARGVDTQLEVAIQEIMRSLESNPPSLPDMSGQPSRALPRLPRS